MKKILTLFGLVAMFAIAPAYSDLNHSIELQENEYNFDITKLVSDNFLTVSSEGVDRLKIAVNAPFPCTILAKGDLYTCDNSLRDQNKFSLAIGEIPTVKANGKNGQYTREIATVFVKPMELQLIKGYPAGSFAYPIRIRQYGADGTIFLTGEQVRAWKNDHNTSNSWNGDYNQHYVLATVKSVSAKYKSNGIHKPNSTIGETWLVPVNHYYYPKESLPDLEAIDMVVTIDGEDLNLVVHQFACYKLFENFNVKVGDTVEMNVPNSGISVDADNPNTIWVTPQDFVSR